MNLYKMTQKTCLKWTLIVSMSLVGACQKKNTELLGPAETGGGDVSRVLLEGMEEHIKGSVLFHHNLLENYVLAYQKTADALTVYAEKYPNKALGFFEDAPEEIKNGMGKDLLLKVYQKTNKGELLLQEARKLNQPLILSDRECLDGDNKKRQGSAVYEGRLCISSYALAKSISFLDYDSSIRALLMHELAHKAGLNEQEAKHIETLFNFLGKNIGEAERKLKLLEVNISSISDRIEGLSNDFSTNKNNLDSEISQYEEAIEKDIFLKLFYLKEKNYLDQYSTDEIHEMLKSAWAFQLQQGNTWSYNVSLEKLATLTAQHIANFLDDDIFNLPQIFVNTYMNKRRQWEGIRKILHQLEAEKIQNHKDIRELFREETSSFENVIDFIKNQSFSLDSKSIQKSEELFRSLQIVLDIVGRWDRPNYDHDQQVYIIPEKLQTCYEKTDEEQKPLNYHEVWLEKNSTEVLQEYCKNFGEIYIKGKNAAVFFKSYSQWFIQQAKPLINHISERAFAQDVFECVSDGIEQCKENYSQIEDREKAIIKKAKMILADKKAPSKAKYLNSLLKKD